MAQDTFEKYQFLTLFQRIAFVVNRKRFWTKQKELFPG